MKQLMSEQGQRMEHRPWKRFPHIVTIVSAQIALGQDGVGVLNVSSLARHSLDASS